MSELRNEIGLLTRTFEILEKERKQLHDELVRLEEEKGILGYFSNQENLKIVENFEKDSSADREELTSSIAELNNKISQIKNHLQPLIKELKPLRSEHQNLQSIYDEAKSKYDSIATSLDSKFVHLKEEVKELEQRANSLESALFKLNCELELLAAKKSWVEENHRELGENQIIERLQVEISESTKALEQLTDKHRQLKENEQPGKTQMKMWADLIKLMKLKNEIYNYTADKQNESKKKQTKDYLAVSN